MTSMGKNLAQIGPLEVLMFTEGRRMRRLWSEISFQDQQKDNRIDCLPHSNERMRTWQPAQLSANEAT